MANVLLPCELGLIGSHVHLDRESVLDFLSWKERGVPHPPSHFCPSRARALTVRGPSSLKQLKCTHVATEQPGSFLWAAPCRVHRPARLNVSVSPAMGAGSGWERLEGDLWFVTSRSQSPGNRGTDLGAVAKARAGGFLSHLGSSRALVPECP